MRRDCQLQLLIPPENRALIAYLAMCRREGETIKPATVMVYALRTYFNTGRIQTFAKISRERMKNEKQIGLSGGRVSLRYKAYTSKDPAFFKWIDSIWRIHCFVVNMSGFFYIK